MAGEYLSFDAAGSNIDGTDPGTALNIGPGTSYRLREFSAPAPPQTVQYAGSVATEGSLPASRKHENRQITLKIMCDTAAALRTLEAKIGKVARSGGTLKWVLPNAEIIYFDPHAVDAFEPTFQITFYRDLGRYCDVDIVLPAAPYGRGPSVTLSAHTETTAAALTFTETAIKGTWYGLADLKVNADQAGVVQKTMLWGVENLASAAEASASIRPYSRSTDPLLIEAENATYVTPSVAAVAIGPAGASGAGSNTLRNLSLTGAYATQGVLDLTGHRGSYRLIARAQAVNAGTVQVRASYGKAGTSTFAPNDADTIVAASTGTWRLLDLGEIKCRPGDPSEGGGALVFIDALSSTAGDDLYFDLFLLFPISDGSGVITDTSGIFDSALAGAGGSVRLLSSKVVRYGRESTTSSYYGTARPQKYEGDYLFVPPAGPEARSMRMLVKFSRGLLGSEADSNIDDLSATLTYTPRYLVVPEP